MGWVGWMDGLRLSRFGGLLRAPTVLISAGKGKKWAKDMMKRSDLRKWANEARHHYKGYLEKQSTVKFCDFDIKIGAGKG